MIPKTTSEKLNALAAYIEAHPKRFDMGDADYCIVGTGRGLNGGDFTHFRRPVDLDNEDVFKEFVSKYGVTYQEASDLFNGKFDQLGIGTSLADGQYLGAGLDNGKWVDKYDWKTTSSDAVYILRQLAKKYEKRSARKAK